MWDTKTTNQTWNLSEKIWKHIQTHFGRNWVGHGCKLSSWRIRSVARPAVNLRHFKGAQNTSWHGMARLVPCQWAPRIVSQHTFGGAAPWCENSWCAFFLHRILECSNSKSHLDSSHLCIGVVSSCQYCVGSWLLLANGTLVMLVFPTDQFLSGRVEFQCILTGLWYIYIYIWWLSKIISSRNGHS